MNTLHVLLQSLRCCICLSTIFTNQGGLKIYEKKEIMLFNLSPLIMVHHCIMGTIVDSTLRVFTMITLSHVYGFHMNFESLCGCVRLSTIFTNLVVLKVYKLLVNFQ